MSELSAADVIAMLELERHPEGGWFRQTFAEPHPTDDRHVSTAIYYLLEGHDLSAWHRVDAAEIWHHYAGAPLVITVSPNGHDASAHHLGTELAAGQRPQFVVPAGWWQSATSLGAWTLFGCTVAPGFEFKGFEMAPPGWRPTPRKPSGG